MHAEVESRKDEIAEICRRCGVRRLDLFGSAARGTGFDPGTGDADFLVDFQGELPHNMLRCFTDLEFGLAGALGRRVDVASMGAIGNKRMQALVDRSPETVHDRGT
ncbi:MAG: DNA polymerase III subunit beta [Boseongicola sp. SB0664_bin_43]|uniref:DNA polymerase III subunit beta n=1 Tax=Boseongicola sp. SB0664_bin_43 TaxID=2604844 RepID=A0A6B0XYB3_9RHOB|nr:DNA polymerase III subunit beta [Boseongicola sp. SB0664_bin_43]MYK31719.1 DNA polymerase III subunit beta [Boseongicola sp. SB0670_bin_30]